MTTDRTDRRMRLAAALVSTILLAACGGGSSSGGGSSGGGSSGGGSSGGGSGGGGSGGGGSSGGGSGGGGTKSYTVGGTVAALSGSGLTLQNNTRDNLPLSSSGAFTFVTPIASGSPYSVTVETQPSNPSQTCAVANATGTVASANVENVALTCTTNTYVVGGTLSGLSGSGMILQDNAGDDLTVTANGSFSFATTIASGANYNVTIKTQPAGPIQVCSVANATGTVGSAAVSNVIVSCGPISLLAGGLGGYGNVDGDGANARFGAPNDVAVDSAGNIVVADASNNVIRKITPDGKVSILSGTGKVGSADGSSAAAMFSGPGSVATDSAGNVYVADSNNCTIRKITPAGVVSTLAGSATEAGPLDGIGSAARFSFPTGIAVDPAGTVYVADTSNNTIRKISPTGVVSTVAGAVGIAGSTDATGTAATFDNPEGIAVDPAGNLFVADTVNSTIRKITTAGVVTTVAGSARQPGSAGGAGSAARFDHPVHIEMDASGNLYVADFGNNMIRKITPAGFVSTVVGAAEPGGAVDGGSSVARFNGPSGVAMDPAGNLYVADTENNTIRKITPALQVSTLAGAAQQLGSVDGTGSNARFANVGGVATDPAGNVYVSDSDNVTIRKITSAGVVSTYAGSAGKSGSTDGTVNAARFASPYGVAVDAAGSLYVADAQSDTIRKITPDGMVITLAGTAGMTGKDDGTGPLARFNFPEYVAVDALGTVYVSDSHNFTVRKITSGGVVTTLAGTAGTSGSGDSAAGAALFGQPAGMATDAAGNVYVADLGNKTIRRITPAGVVTTLAGKAGVTGNADGTGSAASFDDPTDVAVDSVGNLYVSDESNSTVRRITPDGAVTTVAGTPGSRGVHLGPLPGSLNGPRALAVLPGPGVTLVEADSENSVLQIKLP